MIPGDQSATVRRLKMLVVALILSNLATGIFAFYFLRQIDTKYSVLIAEAVPSLNELQTLTAASMDAMRSTNPSLFGDSAESRAEMAERARAALERDNDLRASALKREWFFIDAGARQNFQDAGEAFSQTAAEVVRLLGTGKKPEASKQREQLLRPAFERYVAATTKAADVLRAESLRTSDKLTARTGNMSNMLLGLASWPVILFCMLLLVTALFVIAVLLKVFCIGEEAT